MKLRGAIFDLDGTLADTLVDIASSMNRVLRELGLPTHEPTAYKAFVGAGVPVLAERALPDDELSRKRAVVDAFRASYAEHMLDSTRPYEGIDALLADLDRRGVRLAVLSNKPDDLTKTMVHRLFGRDRFRVVLGQRQGAPRKPDPTVAIEIAGLLEVDPADCLLVGDSLIDMETARSAGMLPVGVLWGFRGRQELVDHGARALLKVPADLLDLLDFGVESRASIEPI